MPMAVNRIKVWQCIGCGRIDDPRPCVGVCRDEKVEWVLGSDHDAELARANERIERLRDVVSRIAHTRPRDGQWEKTWLALQERARDALGGE